MTQIVKLAEDCVIHGALRKKGQIVAVPDDFYRHDIASVIMSSERLATKRHRLQDERDYAEERQQRRRREIKFQGRIDRMPKTYIGDWVIGGRVVRVSSDTKLKGKTPAVGLLAKVKGFDWGEYVEASAITVFKPTSVAFEGEIEALPE